MRTTACICAAAILLLWAADGIAAPGADSATTLKSAAAGHFMIGVGVSDRIPGQSNNWPLLQSQFSIVTPENCMKPVATHAYENSWEFGAADRFVQFAEDHQLKVVGHCLVWAKDDRTPEWFFRDGTNTASPQLVLRRMRNHVETLAARYRGRIAMWDVVNEALDDGTNFLRPSRWVTACGEDFLTEAFAAAHRAAPNAFLIYNDYNNEYGPKRDKMFRLLGLLRNKGARVDAIGLQGHYQLDTVPFGDLDVMFERARQANIKVVVSELDIDVIPRSKWWAEGGKHRDELTKYDPYKDGCPPEILKRQADQYRKLFEIFRKHSDVIARVTFWDLHDGESWLNYFPWRRVNHPLLFDRQQNPKPAYFEVIQALTDKRGGH